MTAAPTSAWADRPVKAARTGFLVSLALVPVAALGCLVSAFVLLITWTAAELGARRSATAFAGALMASYLVKLVVVGVLLSVLRDVDGADRTSLGVAAVVGLLVALVVEARVITSTRAPYVEPVPRREGP